MARDRKAEVNAAAQAASEAARTLQARGQEKKVEAPQAPKVEVQADPGAMAKALKNRPSSQAMDEILAKRGLDKDELEEPKVEQKEETKAEEPKVEKTEPVVEEVKAEVVEATTEETKVEAPKTVKVKVDGEEFDVEQSEIDEAGGVGPYRIMKAMENRLKKASELVAEAQKQKAQAPKEPEKPSVSRQQFIAERMDKIRFGTPEEAAQAQLEIMEYGKEKQLDPSAISNMVKEQIKNENAVAKFRTNFPDIANNPILWDAAASLERRKSVAWEKSGRPVDWDAEYSKIGNEIRSAFGRQSQPTTQTVTASTPSSPSKEEKKAGAVVTLPTAGARAALPKEDKEPTPDEERKSWFAETKKARGQ